MGLNLYSSNRLELLLAKIKQTFVSPLEDPFAPEIFIVQSKGMEKWLSLKLSELVGISANIKFHFPNAFINEYFRKLVSSAAVKSRFDTEIMTIRIMQLLSQMGNDRAFDVLKHYINIGSNSQLRLYQLSEQISDTFDQYITYRPDWISKWNSGEDEHWQARLWRELSASSDISAPSLLFDEFEEALRAESKLLPERMTVFGVTAIPEFHMRVLEAISKYTTVNLFLMNPCRYYWGDISSSGIQPTDDSSEDIQGNPLLASMGLLGRDWFDSLNDYSIYQAEDIFEDNGQSTILQIIQSDILNMVDRRRSDSGEMNISANDCSISIHSCYSPMREVEALFDWLLNLFDRESDLKAGDIIVMAPDIEVYAPYIEAKFAQPVSGNQRIPYSFADRGIRKTNKSIDTFFNILELRSGRFSSSEIVAIIENEAVYRRFDISLQEIEIIRIWVQKTQIRWGSSPEAKRLLNLPPYPENTWLYGLQRMLLGYAMPSEGSILFKDVFPYDDIEGENSVTLGKLAELVKVFSDLSLKLNIPRTLSEWSEFFNELIETVFEVSEKNSSEILKLRAALVELKELEHETSFSDVINISVVISYLEKVISISGHAAGFLSGGITFCSLLPMRSIPSRVISVMGLNGDTYPRLTHRNGFDLMSKNPRRGDRNKKNDDRYLFLEVLCSARDYLFLSYIGRNIQDNSHIPPSVLISELTDYIEGSFSKEEGDNKYQLFYQHPLQAFSSKYFTGENNGLFSFSSFNKELCEALLAHDMEPPVFMSKRLNAIPDHLKEITIDDLCAFFSLPIKYLFNRRLNIIYDNKNEILEDKEPFKLDGLQQYNIKQRLLECYLNNEDLLKFRKILKAEGLLPHGSIGNCSFDLLTDDVKQFADKLRPFIKNSNSLSIKIAMDIDGYRLKGSLNNFYDNKYLFYRYGKLKGRNIIGVWIKHLILNSISDNYVSGQSVCIGLDDKAAFTSKTFSPVDSSEKARECLSAIVKIYDEGLRKPILFLPDYSWEYYKIVRFEGKSSEEALDKMSLKWKGVLEEFDGRTLPYYLKCFGNMEPFNEEFQRLSIEAFSNINEILV